MDIRTIVFIIGLTNIIQLVIIYHQYKTNKAYKGLGWWVLWILFETIGFSVLYVRSFTEFTPLLIVIQNSLIVLGTLFTYLGLMSFLEKKIQWKVIISIATVFLLLIFYFSFIDDNVKVRTIVINYTLGGIAVYTLFNLRRNSIKSINATLNFVKATFVLHSMIFIYIGTMAINERTDFNTFTSFHITIIQFSDALIIGLLWTFGFIVMVNQRLNSDLKESKEHFEEIFKTTPDTVLIADLYTGEIIEVNDIFVEETGYSREEAVGKSTLELKIWLFPEERNEIVKIVKEGGQCKNKEVSIRGKNGTIKKGLISALRVTLNGRECLLSVVRDVTQLRQEEEARRINYAKYKVLFDSIPIGITISDNSGKIIESNSIAEKLLGLSKEEVLNRSIDGEEWKVVDKDGNEFPKEEYASLKALKENRVIENVEMGIVKGTNEITWINVTAAPIPIANYGVVVAYNDITDRKKAEEIINKSREKLEEAQKTARLGSWEWDIQTNELICSDEFLRIFGFERDAFGNNTNVILSRLHPEDKEYYLQKLVQGQKNPIENSFEYRIVLPGGITKHILANGKNILDNNNKPVKASGTVQDITERKRIEEEIKNQYAELQRINREKDKFFSIIAHDLRSPFTGLLGLTELMAGDIKTFTPNEIQEIALKLNQSANNLFRLLNNLLEWSRMQRGTTEFNPETINLKSMIQDTFHLYTETAASKGIGLYDTTSENFEIKADKSMFDSILRNLVSNAIKFTESGGKVTLSAQRNKEYNIIEVSDTGIGMSIDLIHDLFRIDKKTVRKGTEDEPGTGLGLLLCKEFINKHKGELMVNSKPGKGSTFTVILP